MSDKVRLWRCYNPKCAPEGRPPGFDFAAPEGKCPQCGITEKDPQFGRFLTPRVVIHFDPPSGVVDGVGKNHLACQPTVPIGKYRSTASVHAVTCPACQETAEFRAAQVGDAVHPDFDVPVSIDLEKMTMKLDRPATAEEVQAPAPPAATTTGGCRQ